MPEFLQGLQGPSPEVVTRLLLSALSLAAVWLTRRILMELLERNLEDSRSVYQWSKASAYVATVLIILLLGQIWLVGVRSLGTFLGLLTAGLAIALRDMVASFAGWVFIVLRRPFEVGDRIQLGEHAGDVVDIRIFQLSILEIGNWVSADQSTGRIIHLPNLKVFTTPIANYTSHFPYLWNEVAVVVTFESDWRRGKQLLAAVAGKVSADISREAERSLHRASRKLLIHYRTLSPIVYTSVVDHGVMLTVRYLCAPRTRRGTAQSIWEEVLDLVAMEPGLDLAYPTHRIVGVTGAKSSEAGSLVPPKGES
ncbi:MAG: mechanosensitive ion channel domain-containing protein [Gemmatimonadota bacterium]